MHTTVQYILTDQMGPLTLDLFPSATTMSPAAFTQLVTFYEDDAFPSKTASGIFLSPLPGCSERWPHEILINLL